MNKLLVLVSIAMAVSATGAQAAGDAGAGQTKSATCAGCHMADGNSVNPLWPKLAGQYPGYLQKQIMDFKTGARKDPTMSAMAAPLTEQDAEDLAAWFASQKQTPGTAEPAQVSLGQRIYRGGNAETGVAACTACHGPTGAGNPPANFPTIAGQHAAYVDKALKDFRAGERANDPGKMMQGVAAKMTDKEIAAVAQFVQGLN